MESFFSKYLEIDRNDSSAAAIAGARERIRRRRMIDPIVEDATLRPSMALRRSETVGEVLERRDHLASLCEPSDEFLQRKLAIVLRQAIGNLCAANDNEPYYARRGVHFSRAA